MLSILYFHQRSIGSIGLVIRQIIPFGLLFLLFGYVASLVVGQGGIPFLLGKYFGSFCCRSFGFLLMIFLEVFTVYVLSFWGLFDP